MNGQMKIPKKPSPQEEKRELSPQMRELILGFDAKAPMKRRPARDAKGRFVSARP
jgi:hypothetical protein